MQLTSLVFLCGFLPLVWILYRYTGLGRSKAANVFLFAVSLLFYAFGSLRALAVLVFVLLFNYIGARQIEQAADEVLRKRQLIFIVCVNVFLLFFYRYFAVWFSFLDGWLVRLKTLPGSMPSGLSFYLFSALSCVFDVYYRKSAAPVSLVNFGLYAAFFGRVNMGPVGNWSSFSKQLDHHPTSRQKQYDGTRLLVSGLFRKVFVADTLAMMFSMLAGNVTWLGSVLHGFAYFFQLYFDFSGYSRMARGIALLFGFSIEENFSLPYTALSVQDFWRRWHISLTNWFRQYVYIPLGGNRVDRQRWIFNVAVVWLLTGLWHGATWPFLVWGIYQGALILLENLALKNVLEKTPAVLRHTWVVLTQLCGWTLFSSATLGQALGWIGRYFGIGISGFADATAWFALSQWWFWLVVAVFISSGLAEKTGLLLKQRIRPLRRWWQLQLAGYALELLVCLVMLVSSSAQTFLYAVF